MVVEKLTKFFRGYFFGAACICKSAEEGYRYLINCLHGPRQTILCKPFREEYIYINYDTGKHSMHIRRFVIASCDKHSSSDHVLLN